MTATREERREPLVRGAILFDAGEHWNAHEAWEAWWKADRAQDRDYLKGLIQYAAACFHLRRGRLGPTRRLLRSARGHLVAHHSDRWPIATAHLLDDLRDIEHALEGSDASMPIPALLRHVQPARAPDDQASS